jgi:hypothetical protein
LACHGGSRFQKNGQRNPTGESQVGRFSAKLKAFKARFVEKALKLLKLFYLYDVKISHN